MSEVGLASASELRWIDNGLEIAIHLRVKKHVGSPFTWFLPCISLVALTFPSKKLGEQPDRHGRAMLPKILLRGTLLFGLPDDDRKTRRQQNAVRVLVAKRPLPGVSEFVFALCLFRSKDK